MRVLIVEDTEAIATLFASHLTARGFAADVARTGAEALARAAAAEYDAITLDLGLPDQDGLAVLAALRAQGAPPIIVVTARDAVAARVAGLDAGADDYIVKPFDLAEAEARLRAVLRRPGLREPATPGFAGLTLDPTGRLLRAGGQEQELTRREAAVMAQLLQVGEAIAVREALTAHVYGAEDEVSANALEATLSRLRRKIAALGSPVRIETLRGIGYRLRAGGA